MGQFTYIKPTKTITTDVEITISHSDLIQSLKEESDFEEILRQLGFIDRQEIGLVSDPSILDTMKLELIKDLMENATLDQLEQFRKSL